MNPSKSTIDSGKQSGTAPVSKVDNPTFVNQSGLNQFDLSQQFLFTARYGELTPFFNMECVGRDRIRLRNSVDLRSYTLSSPLLSSLRMKKSYFQVPLSAILPNTWQYLFTNPLKGDDIPQDAQCRFPLRSFVNNLASITFGEFESNYKLQGFFAILSLSTCILSRGGLFFLLGLKNNFDFDSWLESSLFSPDGVAKFKGIHLQSPYDYLSIDITDVPSLRTALYTYMEYPDSVITGDFTPISPIFSSLRTYLRGIYNSLPEYVNISKLVAYQFAYCQFFTNDKIDNIYNSEMFLNNQKSILYDYIFQTGSATTSELFYRLNGVSIEYDVYSQRIMDIVVSNMGSLDVSTYESVLWFFINTFTLRRSLRYGDYFTGARSQPLAVGNTTIQVGQTGVSVVDVNKSIHLQRFLNAVNRVGSNLINYTKGIFGYEPPKDYHQPAFIASETDFIGGQEVENTADNQGNVTTNLRSSSSKFEFDVFIDNPCYIIGVVTFECTPAYSNTINRDFFHFDRFDYFNPMLQNVGDQPIMLQEFHSGEVSDVPFAYQTRYAEYKHRYSEASGGFVFNLPSWAFIKVDPSRSISSFTIRSRPDEFDRFFSSLTYGSPAGYYHFIISIVNNVDALRPIERQPSLL